MTATSRKLTDPERHAAQAAINDGRRVGRGKAQGWPVGSRAFWEGEWWIVGDLEANSAAPSRITLVLYAIGLYVVVQGVNVTEVSK